MCHIFVAFEQKSNPISHENKEQIYVVQARQRMRHINIFKRVTKKEAKQKSQFFTVDNTKTKLAASRIA